MRKPVTEDDIQGYVDNQLPLERRDDVESYLDANGAEAARAAEFQRQAEVLRAALDPVVREPIPVRLNLAHIAANRQSERLPKWRYAAATMVLLVAGAAGGWSMRGFSMPPSEGVAALAEEASATYGTFATDAVRPVEVRADDIGDLTSLASATLGKKAVLPDLSQSGYRLMGGRVVSTTHGPGFMLVYDDDKGGRLVVMARHMIVDQNKPMVPHADGDVNGWSWANSGTGYSVVAPRSSESLHPLADQVRAQVTTVL